METYKLQICKQLVRYQQVEEADNSGFLICLTLDKGMIAAAKLKWRRNEFRLSNEQLAIINNRNKYTVAGDSIVAIFDSYRREQRYSKPVEYYLCEYCAYLLFFHLITCNDFYRYCPIRSPIPHENFSSFINRSSFPISNLIFETIRKTCSELNVSNYCYTNINFLSNFDLLFKEGKVFDLAEVTGFCISLILEVSGIALTRCSKMLNRELSARDSHPESCSELSVTETDLSWEFTETKDVLPESLDDEDDLFDL